MNRLHHHGVPGASPPGGGAGFSLVELMVAMMLGLLLTSGVVAVLVSTSRNHAELGDTSRQIESGRYAMQTLAEDIHHAGFYGNFYRLAPATALPDPCAADLVSLRTALNLPLQGYAGAASAPLACLPGYVPNTDVLVIRRAATVATAFDPSVTPAVDELVRGAVYIQSVATSTQPVLNIAAATGNDGVFSLTNRDRVSGTVRLVRAQVRRFIVRLYYLRQCSDCSGTGDGRPTLTRVELQNTSLTTDAPTPIAEGIENLQLRYGIDDTGNGPPMRWVASPSGVADWSNVVAVEVNLLVRSLDRLAGYADAKGYVLGDVTLAATGDNYKRHVLTSIVRVVNTSARRER